MTLKLTLITFIGLFLHLASTQFNPSILQDSRDLPKVDGTFGFLYRTEDGIAHAAKGDADGVIHGRFSYTDPTGLKVNYNYNAGTRVAPGYHESPAPARNAQEYQAAPAPVRSAPAQPRREEYREAQYDYNGQYEPEPEYVPRTRPQVRAQQITARPQISPEYRQVEHYPVRRTRPSYERQNELYDEYRN